MRKKLRLEQKAAILIIIIFAVTAFALGSGKFLINITDSVPLGLWLRSEPDSKISRGDFVEVEFKYFSSIDWLPDSYPPRSYAGKVMPFIKNATGLPGGLNRVNIKRFRTYSGQQCNNS